MGVLEVSHMPSPSTLILFVKPRPRTPKEHQTFTLEEDFYYLANLTIKTLEEELLSLTYYTQRVFAILAISGSIIEIFSRLINVAKRNDC